MEYFVRTSHIVSGLIYVITFIGVLYVLGQNSIISILGVAILMGFITLLVPIFIISSIHYIVLKKFHPWAKITEENETQKEKVEYIKITDGWNIKVAIRNSAIFGVLYSLAVLLIEIYLFGFRNQGLLFLIFLANTLGCAIGGVLLSGTVAVIRNKFIVRK